MRLWPLWFDLLECCGKTPVQSLWHSPTVIYMELLINHFFLCVNIFSLCIYVDPLYVVVVGKYVFYHLKFRFMTSNLHHWNVNILDFLLYENLITDSHDPVLPRNVVKRSHLETSRGWNLKKNHYIYIYIIILYNISDNISIKSVCLCLYVGVSQEHKIKLSYGDCNFLWMTEKTEWAERERAGETN